MLTYTKPVAPVNNNVRCGAIVIELNVTVSLPKEKLYNLRGDMGEGTIGPHVPRNAGTVFRDDVGL